MKIRRVLILALLSIVAFEAVAQTDSILVLNKDTVAYRYTPINTSRSNSNRGGGIERNRRHFAVGMLGEEQERRVNMAFLPTVYYTPSTSAGVALIAMGKYRLGKQSRKTPASDFSIYATASLTGFYRVGVDGHNFFNNDNQRIAYNAEFYSMPTRFWGVGYDAAMSNSSIQYLSSRTLVDMRFLQRLTKGLYVGVGADFDYNFGRFSKGKYASEEELLALLGGERTSYSATGLSLLVEYDTRDAIANPKRGVYVALQAKVRPKAFNNVGHTLWMGGLTANYYQRLWKGATLAFDLRAELNSKATPWVYNASLGSSLRGYYAGRFNDLCAISLQAELRQAIYKRFGAVAWGGAANVFRSFGSFAWSETLPTYGVGLRYEVLKGVNLRLDYGFGGCDARGKLIHGAIFSVNEAF